MTDAMSRAIAMSLVPGQRHVNDHQLSQGEMPDSKVMTDSDDDDGGWQTEAEPNDGDDEGGMSHVHNFLIPEDCH